MKKQRQTDEIKTAKRGNKKTQRTEAEDLKRNVQAFSPLYSVLSLCNFGFSHVGHQTTIFFSSPNFVYSVIINQSRCMTAFWA